MFELLEGVGWSGVFAGFVLSFMLGYLWYGPNMFGEAWAKGVGVPLADGSSLPVAAMIAQAAGTLVLACLLGIATAMDAPLLIALIIFTLMLFIVSNGKYVQKSNVAVAIEAAYIFAMGVVMVTCQAIF